MDSTMVKFDTSIKTRFCPSPTGLLHLGNLRTALFSFLLAKSAAGDYLLRIEDTDRERSQERFTEQLQADLLWLGLEWQEGPDHDLGRGPYHQSQRGPIYNDYYQRLLAMDMAYPCFCTEEELAIVRKIQSSTGKPPRYPGTCQNLTSEQIEAKKAQGLSYTLRFRVPLNEEISFDDLVRGRQTFQTNDLGDFIISRTDGTAPFLFCNAIDDALMEVTHVMRGEDHVTNTPRQILILRTLSLPIPVYGHISLILGSDGSLLSKRHGSRSLVELRQEGFLPLAIINYLARLGHYYGHDQFLSLDELAAQFKVPSLSTSPAKYNEAQLHYWQKQAIDHLSEQQFWNWVNIEVLELVPEKKRSEFFQILKPNLHFPSDASRWAQIIFGEMILTADFSQVPRDYFAQALTALELQGPQAQLILNHLKTTLNLKGKELFQPLRLALTGEEHGPEFGKLMSLIDVEVIKQRLLKAKQRVENL